MVRGRPNWWVILAVSLALMALLVATVGTAPRGTGHPGAVASDAHRPSASGNRSATGPGGRADGGAAATTSTTLPARPFAPAQTPTTGAGSALLDNHSNATSGTSPSTVPPVTTTTLPPTTTTTTTAPSAALPADRTQTQGYLSPPLQTSNSFAFTGTGAMQISVLWSGSTYLTMKVSCPNGSQSVGGTAAMAASLPDASGSCLATVSEPASETASLTYTITIGPAGA